MNCSIHNKPLTRFCITAGCTLKAISCDQCISQFHPHKKLETLRKQYFEEKIKRLLDYSNLSTYMVAQKDEARRKMQKLFDTMREQLDQLIEQTQKNISKFINNFLSGQNDQILGDLQQTIRLIQQNKFDTFTPDFIRRMTDLLEFSSSQDLQLKEKNRFFFYIKRWHKEIQDMSYKLESVFNGHIFRDFKQTKPITFIKRLQTKSYFSRILQEKSQEIEIDELGKDSKLAYLKALDFYQSEDYDKSIQELRRLIQLNPGKTFLYIHAGKAMFAKKNYNQALDYFDKAISLDQTSARAYSEKAKVYNDLRRFDKSLQCFNHAIYNGMNQTEDYFNRGLAEYQLKKYEDALASFSCSLDLDPLSIAAWEFKGNSYMQLGNHAQALNCFNQILKIDPNDVQALNFKGMCYIEMRKGAEGLACFDRAIEIDPKDALSYNNKGSYLMKIGKYSEAIVVLNKGLECDLQNPITYFNKGNCFFQLQQYQQALLSFEMTCMLQPNNARHFNSRGLVLEKLNRKQEALRAFERSIQIEPMPTGYNNIAEILFSSGKLDESERMCQKAIQLGRNFTSYHIKGRIKQEKKSFHQALEFYNTALEIDPRVKDVYVCKARCLRKMGRENDATKIERMIVDVMPARPAMAM